MRTFVDGGCYRTTRRHRYTRTTTVYSSTSSVRFTDILNSSGCRFIQPGTEPKNTSVRKPPTNPDLEIQCVNLNIQENSIKHKTDEYFICEKSRGLVVRRGQPFDVTIEFNKEYDPTKHDLRLVFLGGDDPSPTKGTRVSIILSDKDVPMELGAWITKNEGRKLTVRINTPPTCYIGVWSIQLETLKTADRGSVVFEYTHPQDIYVLFNPWCKDDTVFFPDVDQLDEYILNDMGKIYTGNGKQINGKKWNFGQFEENILECAMFLLNNGMPSWGARGDPVKVSRKLSAMVNSNDDDGVLVGNWSGNYDGGKSPLAWNGSVAILNQFYRTKEPVCFGQCWVFSGVVTTLCRAIGIPARSVTNFSSAHDSDGSISIDTFWSESGEPIEELNRDSVWNFHVWNDVWMARPDLPKGYGGWQAIDATPQETSEGVFCCGPASIEAIKRGEVYLPYDTPFVFAEVNADRVNWEMTPHGDPYKVGLEKRQIGTKISTKLPKGQTGRRESFCYDVQREDITNLYKFKEGSDEERAAVIKANQESSKRGLYDEGKQSDVEFELVDKETVPYGNSYEVILKITNRSDEPRKVSGCISTSSIHYTGVPAHKIKTAPIRNEVIPPKTRKDLSMKVTFNEYFPKLVDQCHLKMSCMCKVLETKHTYVSQDTFRLIKPDIDIKVPGSGKVGQKMTAEISFTNPLPCALTYCELTVEGPGLQEPLVVNQGRVHEGKSFQTTFSFVPRKPGVKELVVAFHSKELAMVEGSCEITVTQ